MATNRLHDLLTRLRELNESGTLRWERGGDADQALAPFDDGRRAVVLTRLTTHAPATSRPLLAPAPHRMERGSYVELLVRQREPDGDLVGPPEISVDTRMLPEVSARLLDELWFGAVERVHAPTEVTEGLLRVLGA